jgi:hypothetical protein
MWRSSVLQVRARYSAERDIAMWGGKRHVTFEAPMNVVFLEPNSGE